MCSIFNERVVLVIVCVMFGDKCVVVMKIFVGDVVFKKKLDFVIY